MRTNRRRRARHRRVDRRRRVRMWTALGDIYHGFVQPLLGAPGFARNILLPDRMVKERDRARHELEMLCIGTALDRTLIGKPGSFAAAVAHRQMLYGPPVPPASRWQFYVGMTRERFDELKAAGKLPITIGTYDETMAELAKQEDAREQEIYGKSAISIVVDDV